MSEVERFKAMKEIALLQEDAQRLQDLQAFLSATSNPGNVRRVEEITEQLRRIEQRLGELQSKT